MMSLLMWMRAVRDHRPKPGPRSARYPALWALALRMRPDGSGFVSQRLLAEDVELGESTVRRHLKWAIDTGYLLRTRRGHRLGNGSALASEYQLTQPLTDERLTPVSTAQITGLNRSDNGSQPLSPDRPRESSARGSSSSLAAARQAAPAAEDDERPIGLEIDPLTRYIFELINEAFAKEFSDLTDEPCICLDDPPPLNVEMAKRLIAGIDRDFQPRNLRAYLRKMAEAGDLFPRWERIEEDVLGEQLEQLKAERAAELAAAPDCHHGTQRDRPEHHHRIPSMPALPSRRSEAVGMTAYRCATCGRDLRLIPHKVTEDGRRWCLSCSPTDETRRATRVLPVSPGDPDQQSRFTHTPFFPMINTDTHASRKFLCTLETSG